MAYMANFLLTKLAKWANFDFMKLRTYLENNNIRANDFATSIGVSPSTVGRWVKNERYPRPEQFQMIAAATNGAVTANDFYDISQVPA